MTNVLLIVLIGMLLFVAPYFIMRWRVRRAVPQVIRIFRENNAVGSRNAKTHDELGLRPVSMFRQMLRGRDYKQHALSALMGLDVIQMTEEGRLYLAEDKLLESGIDRRLVYPL